MQTRYRDFLAAGEQAGLGYSLGVPRKVPLGVVGGHMGQRAGSSLEFKEHRDYQPGDDVRRIDWSAYARSDRLAVKLYREEVTPHLDIVLDGSRSMELGDTAKVHALLGLAALLATAAENAGYTHCAWLAGDGCHEIANGRGRPTSWQGIAFDFRGSVLESFARRPPAWRPNGIRVLLSDLLWIGEPAVMVRHLSERATAAVVVQVLARDDVELPERGNLALVDAESDRLMELFLDAEAIARYEQSLANHQENWHRAAVQTGVLLTTAVAEALIGRWHLDELVAAEILKVG
jgi:uncharacterized protein (DUF58 family)